MHPVPGLPEPLSKDHAIAMIVEPKHPSIDTVFARGAYVFVLIDEWMGDSDTVHIFLPAQPGEDTMKALKAHRSQIALVTGTDTSKSLDRNLIDKMNIHQILKTYFPSQDVSGLELSILRKLEKGTTNGST